MEFHAFLFKIFCGYRKTIGKNGNHPLNICLLFLERFYGIKATVAGADQIFDNNYTLSGFKITLNLVLSTMFLRFWSYVNKRKAKCLGDQNTDSDGPCGHSCYYIGLSVKLFHLLCNFFPDKIPYLGVREHDPIIAINRRFPT